MFKYSVSVSISVTVGLNVSVKCSGTAALLCKWGGGGGEGGLKTLFLSNSSLFSVTSPPPRALVPVFVAFNLC